MSRRKFEKLADDSAKAAGEIRSNVEKYYHTDKRIALKNANQAGMMVQMQGESVSEVVALFEEMQLRMEKN